MTAHCPYDKCGWSGSSSQVTDGGCCPLCGTPVNYDGKPLGGSAIADVAEFNRRAIAQLQTCALNLWSEGFLDSIRGGRALSDSQQQNLYRMVNRHHREIGDKAVTDFAAMRGKGAD